MENILDMIIICMICQICKNNMCYVHVLFLCEFLNEFLYNQKLISTSRLQYDFVYV